MRIIQDLIKDVQLPRLIKARQQFSSDELFDVPESLRNELNKPQITNLIQPGMRIAIAVGSRGMAMIPELVRITVEKIKELGASPFIVPAMGSHGGATAEGQVKLLSNLGITEDTAGCPIISSMDVVEVGRLDNGLPVLIDRQAYLADGIVVINRVKPHNGFTGPNESGLVKMLAIGLGKQKGADSCHAFGFKHMPEHIVEMAKIKIATCKILFGIATVENAYDRICHLQAVPVETLIEADQHLLKLAKANMPRIMFDEFDVLIVDRIGKEFSGGGMDGNITGRHPVSTKSGGPSVSRIVVLDVTEKSQGNTNGMGLADVSTKSLYEKVDWQAVYANALTSTVTPSARLPMIMENERDAIKAALKTCGVPQPDRVRVVRIKNTLQIDEIYISEALIKRAKQTPQISLLGDLKDMHFSESGELLDPWG